MIAQEQENAEDSQSSAPVFVAYMSPWKLAPALLFLGWVAIWPFTADFPTTGRRGYYSDFPFVLLFYAGSAVLACCVLIGLRVFLRSMQGLPMVEVWEDKLVTHHEPSRTILRSRIESIDAPTWAGLTIRVSGEKPLTLMVWPFKRAREVSKRLEVLLRPVSLQDDVQGHRPRSR